MVDLLKQTLAKVGELVSISPDALRMRTRRLCERKPSGKCYVDEKIAEDFKRGGESREILEMALLESLGRFGTKRCHYKKIKADFLAKCKVIREKMESKESEVTGRWYTEEAMKKGSGRRPRSKALSSTADDFRSHSAGAHVTQCMGGAIYQPCTDFWIQHIFKKCIYI
ncbi:unnamed protein product [Cladocopium goreaui]|uniref:Uncharacterized protein n=1 Tax=Cladocopium goreaui TaxID=2562237 RepID=A0A9P1C5X7_9DINO|nr:unnamed protein product [Cladocopium goreaui]